MDIIFTFMFCLEALLKIISQGFFICPMSYLRDNWSIIDFLIIISSVIDILSSTINLGYVKIVRMLRSLRPLRFITTNK